MGDRTLSGIVVVVLTLGFAQCGGGSAITPSSPSPNVSGGSSSVAGVNGVIYSKSPAGRIPLDGANVTVVIQEQTGPSSGRTYPLYGIATNHDGAFHVDPPPAGAQVFVYATRSDMSNPCMASIPRFQGSANVELDLFPNSESKEWIVAATLGGPGPIVTGYATAGGVAASAGHLYFEAVYETYSALSPIDSSGRYAFCGAPLNLMFPSRIWIENGRVSCDAKGAALFYAIQPISSSQYFSRDYDLYACPSWSSF